MGHRGRRERRGLPHAGRGRGLPPPRLPADPARAARGQRRARARARATSCPSSSSSATCAATCTRTATGAATASTRCSMSSRPCGRAGTTTWRSPTTPAASAWASASSPTTCAGRSRPCTAMRETLDGFELLAGCEVDIMGDGSLYLPDDVLAELDWVVASLHVAQRQDADRITKRLLAAAEHPYVDVIGHPSGRLIGKRDGYDFDVEAARRGLRRARHVPRDQLAAAPARPAPRARAARARGGRQARDLHRRPPAQRARLPGARRLHGPARGRDARRHRQHAPAGRAGRAAQARAGSRST